MPTSRDAYSYEFGFDSDKFVVSGIIAAVARNLIEFLDESKPDIQGNYCCKIQLNPID